MWRETGRSRVAPPLVRLLWLSLMWPWTWPRMWNWPSSVKKNRSSYRDEKWSSGLKFVNNCTVKLIKQNGYHTDSLSISVWYNKRMNHCNQVYEIHYGYNHNKPTSHHLENFIPDKNDSKHWWCFKDSVCKCIPEKPAEKNDQGEHLITCNSSWPLCTATGMHNGNKTGNVPVM
jgi:hypothetical protein